MSQADSTSLLSNAADATFVALFEQVSEAIRAGGDVDFDAICRDNPEHADRLKRLAPTIAAMAELADDTDSRTSVACAGRRLGDFQIGETVQVQGTPSTLSAISTLVSGSRSTTTVPSTLTTMEPKDTSTSWSSVLWSMVRVIVGGTFSPAAGVNASEPSSSIARAAMAMTVPVLLDLPIVGSYAGGLYKSSLVVGFDIDTLF